jgi:hypothetical protein
MLVDLFPWLELLISLDIISRVIANVSHTVAQFLVVEMVIAINRTALARASLLLRL